MQRGLKTHLRQEFLLHPEKVILRLLRMRRNVAPSIDSTYTHRK